MMWPILILFPFTTLALQTDGCDYSKGSFYSGDGYCINPKANASQGFSWPPLFPGTATFVYASDDLNGTELSLVESLIDESQVQGTESSLVSFWLEYDEASVNNTDIVMKTDMAVYYTNDSATVGGGSNGCETLLGSECIDQINSTLVNLWSTSESYDEPVRSLSDNMDNITSCPSDIFDDMDLLDPRLGTLNAGTTFNDKLLATEVPDDEDFWDDFIREDGVMPPGNSSFTYSRLLYQDRPFKVQLSKAAVAIMMRYPSQYIRPKEGIRNGTTADISVNLVCAKAEGDSEEDEEGGGNDGDGGNAAATAGVPGGLYVTALVLGIAVASRGLW